MGNNFVEQEELAQLIDKLSEKRSGQPLTAEARNQAIQDLDDRIGTAVLNDLDVNQLRELDAILNSDSPDSAIQTFFDKAGINVKQKIADCLETFSLEFLGGENA